MKFYTSIVVFLVFLFGANNIVNAQLSVVSSQNATLLAQTVVGTGGNVVSATLNCPGGAVGTFTNGGATTLGMGAGIVLATGSISDISGPASDWVSSDLNAGGLTQLEAIAGDPTYDACYLDIKLTPVCNTLKIKYIFGSEEWPEWVAQGVNDAFGFFVTGPKPGGGTYAAQNVALVPGSSAPVTINTINANTNSGYYKNNSGSTTIAYDALTTLLTASLDVIPCKTYTIRLAIADGGDGIYDSGVFLQAQGVTCPLDVMATASPKDICVGSSTTLTATSSVTVGNYSWNTGSTNPTITVSPSTTTIYTGFHVACGNTVMDTALVVVHQHESATINYPNSFYCKSGENPIPSLDAVGTITSNPPGVVFVTDSTGEIDLAATPAGTYVIKNILDNPCKDSATQEITILDKPIAAFTYAGPYCPGDTAVMQLAVNGIIGGLSSTPAGLSFLNPSTGEIDIGNSVPGIYTIINSIEASSACPAAADTQTIVINNYPTAAISGTTELCDDGSEATINIDFNGTPGFDFMYSFNGDTITVVDFQGTQYPIVSPDTGTYILTFVQDEGCKGVVSGEAVITVKTPTAVISGGGSSCPGSDANLEVSFTGTAPWTFAWTNGTDSDTISNILSSPYQFTMGPAGDYYLAWAMDSNCIAKTYDTVSVIVFENPTAELTGGETICMGDSSALTFTFTGIAPWKIEYSDTLNTIIDSNIYQNPYVIYVTESNAFTLLAVSDSNCTGFVSGSAVVDVKEIPTLQITSGSKTICDGDSVALLFELSGNAPFTFSISNGTDTYSYVSFNEGEDFIYIKDAGTYEFVSLQDAFCDGTGGGSYTLNLNPSPTAILSGGDTLCEDGSEAQIKIDLSGLPNFDFSYLNGVGDTIKITNYASNLYQFTTLQEGIYTLVQVFSNGCPGTIDGSAIVAVVPLPTYTLKGGGEYCTGDTIPTINLSFTGNSPFTYTYTLDGVNLVDVLADTGITFINYPSGVYQAIQVTDVYGCTVNGTGQATIVEHTLPAVDAGANVSICPEETVTLIGSGGLTALWNPTPTMSAADLYQVQTAPNVTTIYSLTVTDAFGCVNTDSLIVFTKTKPAASFFFSSVCDGTPVDFFNSSYIDAGNVISSLNFDFGDGYSSTLDNPQHLFASCGFKTISLVVIADNACSDTLTQLLTVDCIPNPSFTMSDNIVCERDQVDFVNTTTIASGTLEYNWNFGLGTSEGASINKDDSHTYNTEGSYTVELQATSGTCSKAFTQVVQVKKAPLADFSPNNVCLNQATVFSDLSDIVADLVDWKWDFEYNSGIDVSDTNPVFTYSTPGKHRVWLQVTNSGGCWDSISKLVTVYELPSADFDNSPVCEGSDKTLANLSSSVVALTYSWDTDANGVYDTHEKDPLLACPNNGSFPIKLLVSSIYGCQNAITKELLVADKPKVDFVTDKISGCSPLNITGIDYTIVDAPSVIKQWYWYVADSFVDSGKVVSVELSPGIYNVGLKVISDYGCTDSLNRKNMLESFPVPNAAFYFDPSTTSVFSPIFDFYNLSSGNLTKWTWDFNDTSGISEFYERDARHTFSDSGKYCVTLSVENNYGCIDTSVKCIYVKPEYTFYVPNAFTPNNHDDVNDGFRGYGYGIKKEGYEMYIYDRWGNLVFKSNDIDESWSGRNSKGKMCVTDVYVYKIYLTDIFGRRHYYSDYFSIIK